MRKIVNLLCLGWLLLLSLSCLLDLQMGKSIQKFTYSNYYCLLFHILGDLLVASLGRGERRRAFGGPSNLFILFLGWWLLNCYVLHLDIKRVEFSQICPYSGFYIRTCSSFKFVSKYASLKRNRSYQNQFF